MAHLDRLGQSVMLLAAEAGAEGASDVEAALLLVLRGLRLPEQARRRVLNVAGEVVTLAEWFEGGRPGVRPEGPPQGVDGRGCVR